MKDVMIVTGAGQISLAITRRMGAGKKIVVGDKVMAHAETFCETLNNAGFDAEPFEMDLSDRATIKALVARACGLGAGCHAGERSGRVAQPGSDRGYPQG
jgi:NAD(P)-dependent dehydrogenase (short-subunit alcohol dehydrogenase family)